MSKDSTTVTVFDDGQLTEVELFTNVGVGNSDDVYLDGPAFFAGEFSTAETVTIEIGVADDRGAHVGSPNAEYDATGDYRVTIIDSPSGQIVAEDTVTVE